MAGFKDTVKQFTVKAMDNADVIFRTAVDDLYEEVVRTKRKGGSMPHDTGNLGRSVSVSKTGMPPVDREERTYPNRTGTNGALIQGSGVDDTLYIGVQAAYGPRMNYGFVDNDIKGRKYNQTGNYFIENAEAKWPQFVKNAEARLAE